MKPWRYETNGKPSEPVTAEEIIALLAAGTIKASSLVWKEGTAAWVRADSVPDFFPQSSTVPPVLESGSSSVPPVPGKPPAVPSSEQEDIRQNKVFAVLAYIGLLFLVPLLAAPKSKFARYHTNQGAVLFLTSLVLSLSSFVFMFIPFIGCLGFFLVFGGAITLVVFIVLGIINAASGQCRPLPLIGHFKLLE